MKRLLNLSLLRSVGATDSIAVSVHTPSLQTSSLALSSLPVADLISCLGSELGDGGGRQQDSVQVKMAPSHRKLFA